MSSRSDKKNAGPFESEIAKEKREKLARQTRKKKKILRMIPVAVIILAVVTFFLICFIKASALLDPPRKQLYFTDGPNEIDDLYYDWFSVDGLVGWYIPAQDAQGDFFDSDTVVIASHNYEDTRENIDVDGMHIFAKIVHRGYNVLTFDYSGSGKSEGKHYTWGTQEADELHSVIDYAVNELGMKKVVLLGFGFGAAPAIVEGSRNPYVTGIIADSSYLDIDVYMNEHLDHWTGLPNALFTPVIKAFMKLISGYDIWNSQSPVSAIKQCTGKRFFFFHSSRDIVFPESNAETLYKAALASGNEADYYVISGSEHLQGYIDEKENYMSRVTDFLASASETD